MADVTVHSPLPGHRTKSLLSLSLSQGLQKLEEAAELFTMKKNPNWSFDLPLTS
jgi:hypothetical protein